MEIDQSDGRGWGRFVKFQGGGEGAAGGGGGGGVGLQVGQRVMGGEERLI